MPSTSNSSPPPIAKPGPIGWWARVPGVYKACSVLFGVAIAGAMGWAKLDSYATDSEVAAIRARLDELDKSHAVMAETVRSVKEAWDKTREDIGRLLDIMIPGERKP